MRFSDADFGCPSAEVRKKHELVWPHRSRLRRRKVWRMAPSTPIAPDLPLRQRRGAARRARDGFCLASGSRNRARLPVPVCRQAVPNSSAYQKINVSIPIKSNHVALQSIKSVITCLWRQTETGRRARFHCPSDNLSVRYTLSLNRPGASRFGKCVGQWRNRCRRIQQRIEKEDLGRIQVGMNVSAVLRLLISGVPVRKSGLCPALRSTPEPTLEKSGK